MSLLSVRNISAFDDGKITVRNINFDQAPQEKIAIAGETGSGKTTLLKMIGGLLQPASGSISLNSERVPGPNEVLIPGHPKIGYLSQHFELRNNYKVVELLDMANLLSADEAEKIYTICDIAHLRARWTDELSGGEKQRISLAKLLTTSPTLLLLDEPFSNLDLLHKRQMKNVIERVGQQLGISCILVSHDAADILSWADTVFFMRYGEIIQQGSARELYEQPANEYCAALLGTYNLINSGKIQVPLRKDGEGRLFFRPENIKLTEPKHGMIIGEVKKVLYWGSYYTIDVKYGNELITVQSMVQPYKPGDTVGLQFITEPYWIAKD